MVSEVTDNIMHLDYNKRHGDEVYIEKLNDMKISKKKNEIKEDVFEGISVTVKNIEKEVTENHLIVAFSYYGKIKNIKIIPCNEKNKKPHALITYKSPADAAKAIQNMNGKILLNQQIFVMLTSATTQRRRRISSTQMRKAPFANQWSSESSLGSSYSGSTRSSDETSVYSSSDYLFYVKQSVARSYSTN